MDAALTGNVIKRATKAAIAITHGFFVFFDKQLQSVMTLILK
jgi:hypothetical protein